MIIAAVLTTGLVAAAVGWLTQPDRFTVGFAPEQPIPFSHKVHAGDMEISCLYCHSQARNSRHAGIPPTETCMKCHRVTKTDSPDIKTLTRRFADNTPIFWKRVHSLPDHVFFDHRPHVNGGIACQTCHGAVETMDVVAQRMSLRMASCLACHRDPHNALPPDSPISQGAEHCYACHR
ncbi:MAG: cytochrome c3 family protein [Elusimicrobiota bacterium]